MENNDKELSPQASLLLIESMLNRIRNRFSDNSSIYLLWGWVIFFCSITHFILLQQHLVVHPEYVWVTTWLAVLYQVVFFAKRKKRETVKTWSEDILSYIWLTFVVCMFIASFILGRNTSWLAMYPMILMLYGIPTFLSGIVMQFRALRIGGIICWVLAIAATYVPFKYTLLLLSLAVVTAWIIPGYLMKAKYKNQNV